MLLHHDMQLALQFYNGMNRIWSTWSRMQVEDLVVLGRDTQQQKEKL